MTGGSTTPRLPNEALRGRISPRLFGYEDWGDDAVDNDAGNDAVTRLFAFWRDPDRYLIMLNPDPTKCCALVQLGPHWPHEKLPCWCSGTRKDELFCGRHEHYWVGLECLDVEEYLDRKGWDIEYEWADDGESFTRLEIRKRPPVSEPATKETDQ